MVVKSLQAIRRRTGSANKTLRLLAPNITEIPEGAHYNSKPQTNILHVDLTYIPAMLEPRYGAVFGVTPTGLGHVWKSGFIKRVRRVCFDTKQSASEWSDPWVQWNASF